MTAIPIHERYRNRLLSVIAFVVGVAALRESYPILMPVLFAAMVIAAIWPLKRLLDRWLPSPVSYFLTVLALLAILAGFAAAVYLSIGQVLSVLSGKWPRLVQGYGRIAHEAAKWGIPINAELDQRRVSQAATMMARSIYSFTTYLGFIAIVVVLGIPEIPRVRKRLGTELHPAVWQDLFDIASESARKIRSYLGTTLVTSLLTGICSTLFALATGLDLALVWGLLNFLLNFVPVIGNVVGIIPPVLYAFLQFDGWTMPLIVLVGFVVLQLTISNIIYPLLQGRQLSLSPVAIIVAMAFWSWIWGIAGALIAVPLTAVLVILAENFDRTRWIAKLIASDQLLDTPA